MTSSITVFLINQFYFFIGFFFLTLAKAKHTLQGYRTPKPFSISQTDRCIAYDVATVDTWLAQLRNYVGADHGFSGRHILELGPGSDLGVGLTLLARGAASYSAVDAHDLVRSVPQGFYQQFFEHLKPEVSPTAIAMLEGELASWRAGKPDRLNHVARTDFDIERALNGRSIDLILSQAAFEHFEDIDRTVGQVSRLASDNALLAVSVDLQTHSRWIRDKDPDNIYRYPTWLYRLFWFKGIPNRVRPREYKAIFEKYGWKDIQVTHLTSLPAEKLKAVRPYLYGSFKREESDMDALIILICARRR